MTECGGETQTGERDGLEYRLSQSPAGSAPPTPPTPACPPGQHWWTPGSQHSTLVLLERARCVEVMVGHMSRLPTPTTT